MLLKNAFATLILTLTHDPKNIIFVGYPKVIPYTKFDTLGSFFCEKRCRQTNRHRIRQNYTQRETWMIAILLQQLSA